LLLGAAKRELLSYFGRWNQIHTYRTSNICCNLIIVSENHWPKKGTMAMLPDEMGDDLIFVNISRPDDIKSRDTRRTIRSRVMREIGRSRRSRKRPPTWELSLNLENRQTLGDGYYRSSTSDSDSGSSSQIIPSSLDPCNTTYYPVQLDSRGLQLIHFSTTIMPSFHL
jgi:hypothetical protein